MCNSFQVLYEVTKDVEDSKIKTLTEEYELFGMEPDKSEDSEVYSFDSEVKPSYK